MNKMIYTPILLPVKRRIMLVVAPLLLFGPLCCEAQLKKENPIDLEFKACLAKDSTNATICDCAFAAYGKWNKELDKAYNQLLRALRNDEERAKLKESEAAWVLYKDSEFRLYDYMYDQKGAKWCLLRQNGRIDIVRSRAEQLQSYFEALKARQPK